MPGIFDDEWRETGPIWPNPGGTRPICLLDVVANGLKWLTLRRHSRLASRQMGHANTAIITVHRPYLFEQKLAAEFDPRGAVIADDVGGGIGLRQGLGQEAPGADHVDRRLGAAHHQAFLSIEA